MTLLLANQIAYMFGANDNTLYNIIKRPSEVIAEYNLIYFLYTVYRIRNKYNDIAALMNVSLDV